MKRKTKLGLGALVLLAGATILTGCTASFCSVNDKARMLYAYDNGVTSYISADEYNKLSDEAKSAYILADSSTGYTFVTGSNIYYNVAYENNVGYVVNAKTNKVSRKGLLEIIDKATNEGIKAPSDVTLDYFHTLDLVVLKDALGNKTISTVEELNKLISASGSSSVGYLKFAGTKANNKLWENWDIYNSQVEKTINNPDKCLSSDFIAYYKKSMNTYINSYRSCIATKDGNYGTYGIEGSKTSVDIEAKTWSYAWKKGFLEGLLIYPIAWGVDSLVIAFSGVGAALSRLLAIVVVTVIVRLIMLLVTFKQTTSSAKMTELQPEITKIQNKYPNANTNNYEKQKMAEEMQRLYKKNKVNPFTTILFMFVQFPVFICVWSALSGSAELSTGSFLGLDLSASISSALFKGANWGAAGNYCAWTALVLFILMSLAQTASMLLPQFMQKRKAKSVAKLGKNPNQKQQDNKMKWFTYIMLVMIIVMGFSLASAMGIYWLVGALFSIGQTLITQNVMSKKKKKGAN